MRLLVARQPSGALRALGRRASAAADLLPAELARRRPGAAAPAHPAAAEPQQLRPRPRQPRLWVPRSPAACSSGGGGGPTLTSGTAWPALGARGVAFQISEDRLREFLEAEVAFFAGQESSSLTLQQVIHASTPQQAGQLAAKELPIRFAQRILQIEGLPGWKHSPEMKEVHALYSQSFRDLRLVELDVSNLGPFTAVIQGLKGRMKGVIPCLASAMRKLQSSEDFREQFIDNWLDTFLLSRIGTEMLTSQYIACVTPSKDLPRGRRGGIVDHECDPAMICDRATKHVRKLCKDHYKTEQDIEFVIESGYSCEISGTDRVRFPYVPQYLFYVLVELLKNSARATVDFSGGDQRQIRERPIVVTVGADPSQVAIRVHDSAGGIPFSVADRVWSYMYSTANDGKGGTNFSQQGTPLAGFGVGLPLSRLYARYLGGSLHLLSLPGIGTRAYLYLKRLESEAREELPAHSAADVIYT